MSSLVLLPCLLLASSPLAPARPDVEALSFHAEVVYTTSGDPITGGFVHTNADGKIAGVGSGAAAEGAIQVHSITPGLVDLGSWMTSTGTEHGVENPVWMSALEGVDPWSTAWERNLENGVTTVFVGPSDDPVIGGLASMVKTGGPDLLAERTLAADIAVRGAIGTRPSAFNRTAGRFGGSNNHFVRRPTTRMGVEWVWRKSLYDAIAGERDVSREFEGAEELRSVLRGERPLVIGAATTQDIRTALFLKREFSIPNLVVQNAAEAWKEVDLVASSGAAVALPPMEWDGRINIDNAFHAWNTAAMLHERGVTIALCGNGSTSPGGDLAAQPAYAMRGGLPLDAALAAVTITPARLMGVDDRVGSIEVGKDADLVLWSGPPFQPTSRVVGVVLDGDLVVDPRD